MEEEICTFDVKAEVVGLSEEEVRMRRKKFMELWEALNAKESLLRQKSRVTWLKEGYRNSSFFHASLVLRGRRNQVVAIKVDDLWVKEANQIKNEVIKYFSDNFKEVAWDRPKLDGVQFQGLGERERNTASREVFNGRG